MLDNIIINNRNSIILRGVHLLTIRTLPARGATGCVATLCSLGRSDWYICLFPFHTLVTASPILQSTQVQYYVLHITLGLPLQQAVFNCLLQASYILLDSKYVRSHHPPKSGFKRALMDSLSNKRFLLVLLSLRHCNYYFCIEIWYDS